MEISCYELWQESANIMDMDIFSVVFITDHAPAHQLFR